MTTSAHEPGRTAYEARFAGFTLGPRGVAERWEDLLPVHQAIWARVEQAVRAVTVVSVDPGGDRRGPVAAIEFAIEIDDHYDRLEFLRAWSEGDTSEWPEFAAAPPAEGRAD